MKNNSFGKTVFFPSAERLKSDIEKEKYRQRYAKVLKSTVYALVVVAAVAVLIATLILPVVQIAGTSMEPTLYEGDIVILVKGRSVDRGELCAFSYSNKILIKRVIAVPGDYVNIDADGTVYVNGEAIDEPYVTGKSLGECDVELPLQVPENQYFLMGDQRATSIDSRSTVIGCVTEDQILGRLFLRIWPLRGISFIG